MKESSRYCIAKKLLEFFKIYFVVSSDESVYICIDAPVKQFCFGNTG